MKYVPILFQTAMVNAIENLVKKQTRRTKGLKEINKNPDNWSLFFEGDGMVFKSKDNSPSIVCKPQAKVGDMFWVRETFTKNEGYLPCDYGFVYKAELGPKEIEYSKELEIKWKPSIFMPKEACRIFLKVTNVRIERLHDISGNDAKLEGIEASNIRTFPDYRDYTVSDKLANYKKYPFLNPVQSFFSLWESINGTESLGSNPWVWVYDFEKTEKPKNF